MKKPFRATVVVTRPDNVPGDLRRLLVKKGFEVIRIPTIEIESIADEAGLESVFATGSPPDVGIFVSVNAVDAVGQWLKDNQRQWPSSTECAAVGKKTAEAALGQFADFVTYPESNYGAKSLLQTDAMQNLADKSVAVFQGENGSGMIQSEIAGQCRSLSAYAVYRTKQPDIDVSPFREVWNREIFNFVVITSVTGAKNLIKMFEPQVPQNLTKSCFVVYSSRIQEYLLSEGIGHVIITAEASDESTVATIEDELSRIGVC